MPDERLAFRNGNRVKSLYHCVRNSTTLELIPDLVKQIIRDEMWREHFHEPTQKTYRCQSFQEFIEVAPPQGVGVSIETLWHLCRDDQEAQDLIDQATQGTRGGNNNPLGLGGKTGKRNIVKLDNIQLDNKKKAPTGTSKQAGLRRLRKHIENNAEINALYNMVIEGRMSVNRALIKAGLRSKNLIIPSDIQKAAKALKRHFTAEEIQDLVFYLQGE